MDALFLHTIGLVSTTQLTVVLLSVTIVFAILILGAIIRMYKLKAENRRLTQINENEDDHDKPYKDFTEGHLYENN